MVARPPLPRLLSSCSLAAVLTLLTRAAAAADLAPPGTQIEEAQNNPFDMTQAHLERLRQRRLAGSATDGEAPSQLPSHPVRHAPPPPPSIKDGVWQPIGAGGHGGHAAVYDSRRDEMIVYGGDGGYNDFWALSLSGQPTWRLLQPSTFRCGPDGLNGSTAIYDPVRDQVITFGGVCYFPDDYWLYQNSVGAIPLSGGPGWTGVTGGERPCGREGAAALYDAARDRMIVLGGFWDSDYCRDQSETDVYALAFSGDTGWSRIVAAGTPPSVQFLYSVILDPVRDRLVVFGGSGWSGTPSNSVWTLSLSGTPTWTQLAPAGFAPLARWGQSAIYDPVGDRMVVFGGQVARADYNDVWALSLSGTPTWTQIIAEGPVPSARHGHTAIYDPVRRRMVIYGGEYDPATREVWALSLSKKPSWTLLAPSGALEPPLGGRPHFPAMYDPGRNQIAFFGSDPGVPLREVTTLSLSGDPTWSRTYVSDPVPSSSAGSAAIYDPQGQRIVMFGGDSGNGTADNDTWALSLDGTPSWAQLLPAGQAPPARRGHSAMYDPLRRRLLTFGGRSDSGQVFSDVWALSLSGAPAWTQLHPLGQQPAWASAQAAGYDAAGDRMLVYVGNTGEEERRDLWALSLSGIPTWTQLHPAGPAPDDAVLPTIYDTTRDRFVVFNYSGYCEGYIPQFPEPGCDGMWALGSSGDTSWDLLSPVGCTPIPVAEVPFYDSVDDRLVVVAWDNFVVRTLDWGASKKRAVPLETSGGAPDTPAALQLGSWGLGVPRPDPTIGASSFEFVVPRAADVTLAVFDLSGRQVAVLARGRHEAGRYQASWSGRSETHALPAGVYMVRLSASTVTLSRTLILLR